MSEGRDYQRIERAIAFLSAAADRRPSLDETAAHVGLSPFHFQRLFQRWAGTSPKRFLQHMTAEHAKARLRDARTVLDATFDVGLTSPGRLHDLLVTVAAVTPGEVRSGGTGLCIRHGVHDTPFGRAHIAVTRRGITSLVFLQPDDLSGTQSLEAAWPNAELVDDPTETGRTLARVFERHGERGTPLPLHVRGTNFQLRVWEALLRIPEGDIVSYGSLAAALGAPTASRAVAGAVAANPVAYLIPCHRVLRATGAIGGYRWGTARKQALLGREFALARGERAAMEDGAC